MLLGFGGCENLSLISLIIDIVLNVFSALTPKPVLGFRLQVF